MAFFEVGDVYRQKYLIESVVPFFQGELAIALYDNKRYYLQSASLNRQAPLRAILQYRNLKLPQVIPYLDVYDEPGMLVFIRPYIEIRPLREIITMQELSEEQVIKWVRELLHVEAVLRSKPMSMYLLLDLRNVGVDDQNQLRLFFCGLEKIMVYESKLDWGTFIYSMLSGQFLDGPILKLPKNFKVSRAMSRLIQKSFKEYTVPPVLEQVEIFESKQSSSGLLGKLWGEKKEEKAAVLVTDTTKSISPVIRPIHRTDQLTGEHTPAATVTTDKSNLIADDSKRIVIQERGTLVNEDEAKSLEKTKNSSESKQSPVATVFQEEEPEKKQELWEEDNDDFFSEEPLVGAKDEPIERNQDQKRLVSSKEEPNTTIEEVSDVVKESEEEPIQEIEEETKLEQTVTPEEQPVFQVIELQEEEISPVMEEKVSEEKVEEEAKKEDTSSEQESIAKEKTITQHPESNQATFKVSPALAQLEGQDLSQSFVLKLNKQQEELEKEQQERLKKMREEYEKREQELIEEHRRKLEEEQRRLLEEQRKRLEQQQEELARLQEEARLAKERKQKEELRKAKLAEARKQFLAKQKTILEQEEKTFQERQEN